MHAQKDIDNDCLNKHTNTEGPHEHLFKLAHVFMAQTRTATATIAVNSLLRKLTGLVWKGA